MMATSNIHQKGSRVGDSDTEMFPKLLAPRSDAKYKLPYRQKESLGAGSTWPIAGYGNMYLFLKPK